MGTPRTGCALHIRLIERWHSQRLQFDLCPDILAEGSTGQRWTAWDKRLWQGPHLKVVLMASTTFFRSSSRRSVSARRLMSSFSRASFARPSASDSAFSLCTFFSSSA